MTTTTAPSPWDEHILPTLLQATVQRYEQRNPRSQALHLEAAESLPGGNTRTLLHEHPFPIAIARGENHRLFDEDGHEYVDLVGEMTAGLFGHTQPVLLRAIEETARGVGLSLGAVSAAEAQYARLLCARFGLERVRFTNSGTEANLHALAAARRFTGRRMAIVFSGGYHGSVLSFGQPLSASATTVTAAGGGGAPGNTGHVQYGTADNNVDPDTFIVLRYNDDEAVRRVFRERGPQIAAVLVEGMQGAAGFIPATPAFLFAIQEECEEAQSVFILDEVQTSRLAPGGLQSITFPPSSTPTPTPTPTPLRPTLTTLGKWLGGGLPFGAFGGSRAVMAVYDPSTPGALAHSGTFQNNTLMLRAGRAALADVYMPAAAAAHSARGEAFRARLNAVAEGTRIAFSGMGSLACLHVSERWGRWNKRRGDAAEAETEEGEIRSKEDAGPEDEDVKTLFWLYMLERGFWVQRRGNIALILDMPQEALDRFVEVVVDFINDHKEGLTLK
ncbi:hypothetical protein SLS62_009652 [Diatrype stigma]|uniref:Uncharacterized protein n=1 Tax=Diatrype stigma TaxID=117547 RepID=A0AAN9YIU0_9PEZI